jgi:hypothetical protein
MVASRSGWHGQRTRELRRRVMLPARMRTAAGWTDVCILNLSSRGLMVSARSGSLLSGRTEIWHGQHVIAATIVWRSGRRAGLLADDRIPVEHVMASGAAAALQLTALEEWPAVERRKKPRSPDRHRHHGRLLEFAGGVAAAVGTAVFAFNLVGEAFAKPLAQIQATLGG